MKNPERMAFRVFHGKDHRRGAYSDLSIIQYG